MCIAIAERKHFISRESVSDEQAFAAAQDQDRPGGGNRQAGDEGKSEARAPGKTHVYAQALAAQAQRRARLYV